MSITLNLYQAEAIVKAFGGDSETDITVTLLSNEAHSGPGLYAYYTEYWEEGVMFIGENYEDQERGAAISAEREGLT